MDKSRQLLQETSLERTSRGDSNFSSIERSLPHAMGAPFSMPLLDRASSWLGLHNPLAHPLDPATEEVWLLDNTAYRPVHIYPHAQQPWQAEYVVAYFKKDVGKDVSDAVANIADKVGLGNEGEDRAQGEKTISERLQLFVATIAPARSVNVRLPGVGTKRLGPGGRSAVSEQVITNLGEQQDGASVSIEAIPAETTPHGHGTTHFAAPEGWMVISDIDDSIKITLTSSPIGILRSTFISTPTPIAGMPALYTHISTLLSPTWFYLSASPYNLYPFLRPFLLAHYPPGTLILRDASWQDLGGFLASLTQGTEAYKSARMRRLHAMLPKRKVICVGDSTQSDPEAYGDMYRVFGAGWIRRIFIRKVVGVEGMDEGVKNQGERFERAFRGVPREVWRVFEEPGELYEAVEALKGT
ncbi:MAG: hypothetical protein HETSPECPRED_008306 [Heterodermia speciosa]|uniref:Phosphatidate phosphatase APP1 catalytic domain-containing protein n=1 Tax=Heterodermia speciosa TaxID=116794 RepID=A0A8H3IU32_9LECA|nr:MAG: hypothetical protein HETSPECPRED_008306 [Heterodermia speciosa]